MQFCISSLLRCSFPLRYALSVGGYASPEQCLLVRQKCICICYWTQSYSHTNASRNLTNTRKYQSQSRECISQEKQTSPTAASNSRVARAHLPIRRPHPKVSRARLLLASTMRGSASRARLPLDSTVDRLASRASPRGSTRLRRPVVARGRSAAPLQENRKNMREEEVNKYEEER
jgi:hypothetical protein